MRWLVNTDQSLDTLAILLAGIVTLAVALGLWRYNRALWPGANTGTGVPKASAD